MGGGLLFPPAQRIKSLLRAFRQHRAAAIPRRTKAWITALCGDGDIEPGLGPGAGTKGGPEVPKQGPEVRRLPWAREKAII